jgi:hypothetical protein
MPTLITLPGRSVNVPALWLFFPQITITSVQFDVSQGGTLLFSSTITAAEGLPVGEAFSPTVTGGVAR